MQIEIGQNSISNMGALPDATRRQLEQALQPLAARIARVEVRLASAANGNVSHQCTLTAELAGTGTSVAAEGSGADVGAAVQLACQKLSEQVSQALPDRAPATPHEGRIRVTAIDHERLQRLVDTSTGARDRDAADALADELDRAEVVPPERIAGNVVTMNSRVVFEDQKTGERREISLVYPQDSDPEKGRVSVLAPIGSALLGLSVGQTIDWPLPRGQVRRLRLVEVLYQPEEAGDLHL